MCLENVGKRSTPICFQIVRLMTFQFQVNNLYRIELSVPMTDHFVASVNR